MSNSNFNKNGVDSYKLHKLRYDAFVLITFAIHFGCSFNNANFHHFAAKNIQVFGIVMNLTL